MENGHRGSKVFDVRRKGGKKPRANVVKNMDVDGYGAVCNGSKNCEGSVKSQQSDVKGSLLCRPVSNRCQKKARTEMTGVDVRSKGKEKVFTEFMECQLNSSEVSIPYSGDKVDNEKSSSTSLEEITTSKYESKCDGVESNEGKKCNDDDDNDDEVMILDPVTAKRTFSPKRKRDSLGKMLCWITGIAKNPCDPEVGSLPDISKWKSFGSEYWRQILLAREATFSKRLIDPGADQLSLQRNQRMHSAMYDDHGSGYKEKLRCRESLHSKKKASREIACFQSLSRNWNDLNTSAGKKKYLGQQSSRSSGLSTAELIFEDRARQKVPLGPGFQAVEPQWTGLVSEGDSKWLGTRIWPPVKIERKQANKRDLIGKGRKNSCDCQLPGSTECVRFHIAEKRLKLKQELRSAFYEWNFDKMGEDVGLSWTNDEEKKFKTIVESNPPSLQKSFWGEIYKSFPKKSREELVSYYFNVFMLRRRGYQNRVTPSCINSDDEDESVWNTGE